MPELQRGHASYAVTGTRQVDAVASILMVYRVRVERNASSRAGDRNANDIRQDAHSTTIGLDRRQTGVMLIHWRRSPLGYPTVTRIQDGQFPLNSK